MASRSLADDLVSVLERYRELSNLELVRAFRTAVRTMRARPRRPSTDQIASLGPSTGRPLASGDHPDLLDSGQFGRQSTERYTTITGHSASPVNSVYDVGDRGMGEARIPFMARRMEGGWLLAVRITDRADFEVLSAQVNRTGLFLKMGSPLGAGSQVQLSVHIAANNDQIPLTGHVTFESEAGAAVEVRPACRDFAQRWNAASMALARTEDGDSSGPGGRMRHRR